MVVANPNLCRVQIDCQDSLCISEGRWTIPLPPGSRASDSCPWGGPCLQTWRGVWVHRQADRREGCQHRGRSEKPATLSKQSWWSSVLLPVHWAGTAGLAVFCCTGLVLLPSLSLSFLRACALHYGDACSSELWPLCKLVLLLIGLLCAVLPWAVRHLWACPFRGISLKAFWYQMLLKWYWQTWEWTQHRNEQCRKQ